MARPRAAADPPAPAPPPGTPITLKTVLEKAGASFLRAFVGSILILAPGVLAAPNLAGATTLGIAAVVASIAAGVRAIQVFVPQISFSAIVAQPWATWIDSFVRAFLGAFLTAILGIFALPDYSAWKSAAIAALIGAVTAGIRAVQGLLTPGESPAPAVGLKAVV